MPIPKVIHYCWFGSKPKGRMAQKCIRSWKKYCPEYEIVEWNESNFDVNGILYTKEAYACQKWAFVSDYARLKIIHDHGGVYLDTDVELKKPLDSLLLYGGFLALEKMGDTYQINTGNGFGAVCGHPLIKRLMESYDSLAFCGPGGEMDLKPCSERNTELLKEEGLQPVNELQMLGNVRILPTEYLCPVNYYTGEVRKTRHTLAIHHYQESWKKKPETGNPGKELARRILGTHRYRRLAERKKKLMDAVFR